MNEKSRHRHLLRPIPARRASHQSVKKSGEIGRVFKPQLPGNFTDRVVGEEQQPPGLAKLAVEDQPFWRAVGKAAANIGQTRFGEVQLAGVIRHCPVLMEVAIDHLVEALEQFQLAAHAVRGVIVKPGVTQQQGKNGLRQQH